MEVVSGSRVLEVVDDGCDQDGKDLKIREPALRPACQHRLNILDSNAATAKTHRETQLIQNIVDGLGDVRGVETVIP